MASDTLNAPAGAAQLPISTAQLLETIEYLRRGSFCLRVVAEDEQLDVTAGNAISFLADTFERELAVLAAGVQALCPA